jgi:hypothetical protein
VVRNEWRLKGGARFPNTVLNTASSEIQSGRRLCENSMSDKSMEAAARHAKLYVEAQGLGFGLVLNLIEI